jgi:anti-sigma B factor antagonist
MNFVTVHQVQGRIPVTVLELHDRINLGNISELDQAAREAFTAGAHDMLIDLSKVPSLTSAGIRAILIIHKMLATSGTDQANHLKLVSPIPYVQDVLQVAGLLDYLEVFASLEEAVASF